jgi:hypothetical protein
MDIPSNLPRKLSISFPIWALHNTSPGGAYADLDRFVREHVERGFNCIRFDDGAGLIHDAAGRRCHSVPIVEPYPGFMRDIRQLWCTGNGGECDLFDRLLKLLEAAKKYDVFVILSTWYYLHTYWYCGDESRNRELHALPPHDRFRYFSEELDRLLSELRKRGLLDRVASAEVFNEADGLPFIDDYGAMNQLSVEERQRFRADHEAAIAFLRQRHPDVLFAYDSYTPWTDVNQMPRNLQVWNFHSYCAWDVYSLLEGDLLVPGTNVETSPQMEKIQRFQKTHYASLDDIRSCRAGIPAAERWIRRIWLYNSLDPEKMPELDRCLEAAFERDIDDFKRKLDESLAEALRIRDENVPGAPLVLAEGITYCGSNHILWEEKSDCYWEFLEYAVKRYREAGLWGCVLRTCCGPEDPSWSMRKDELLRLNRLFQAE